MIIITILFTFICYLQYQCDISIITIFYYNITIILICTITVANFIGDIVILLPFTLLSYVYINLCL